jgi:hypothetical protein
VVLRLLIIAVLALVTTGARLASDGEDTTSLREFLKSTRESDVQYPRAAPRSSEESTRTQTPSRKASENKRFWSGDTFPDMELGVDAPYGNLNYPAHYDDRGLKLRQKRKAPPTDTITPPGWYAYGCILTCPPIVDCSKDSPFT